MANIETNGVSLKTIDFTPAEQKATMDQVSRVLVEMATWNKPTYVKHRVEITKSYYEEDYEVVATFDDDPDSEDETMIHLIRTISENKQVTILARKHIFSVTDYEKYEEVSTDKMFPSDSELFGINLISRWGEEKKVAQEIKASIN